MFFHLHSLNNELYKHFSFNNEYNNHLVINLFFHCMDFLDKHSAKYYDQNFPKFILINFIYCIFYSKYN